MMRAVSSSPAMAVARCQARPAMARRSVGVAVTGSQSTTRRNPALFLSTSMHLAASSSSFRCRRSQRLFAASASPSSSRNDDVVDANSVEVALESAALRALLLCWFAMQERSVFATRCLVETCLSLYRRGVPAAAPASTLSLACLSSGGTLLDESEVQLLSLWVALCYMTLDDVGCPRFPGAPATPKAGGGDGSGGGGSGGGIGGNSNAALAGLAGFVRTTVAAFAKGGGGAGSSARRLLLAQAMIGSGRVLSGTEKYMQQNARVIILTLDAAREAGLELARPLDALEAAAAASPSSDDEDGDDGTSASASASAATNGAENGYLNGSASAAARKPSSQEPGVALSSLSEDGDEDEERRRGGASDASSPASSSSSPPSPPPSSLFDRAAGFAAVALPAPPPSLAAAAGGYRPPTPRERTRGVAATLLLAFVGARLGSAYSLDAFVETVAREYRSGRAAAALLAPLTDEEMASVGADAGLKVVAPSSSGGSSGSGGGGSGGGGGDASTGGGDDDPSPPPVPTTATAGSGAASAGRALLSQWVSIVYMTMAQMGVPHSLSRSPGAAGWAFAGTMTAVGGNSSSSYSSSSSSSASSSSSSPSSAASEAAAEALALDRLVRATLRRVAEEKGVPEGPPSETLEAFKRVAATAAAVGGSSSSSSPSSSSSSFMRIQDPSLFSTSSSLEVWGMTLGVARASAEHVAAKAAEWGLLGDDDDGDDDSAGSGSDNDGDGNGGRGPSSSSSSSSSTAASSSLAAASGGEQ